MSLDGACHFLSFFFEKRSVDGRVGASIVAGFVSQFYR